MINKTKQLEQKDKSGPTIFKNVTQGHKQAHLLRFPVRREGEGWMDRVKNAAAPSLTAFTTTNKTTDMTKNGHATLRTHVSSVDSYMDASYRPVKDMLSFSATARTTAPRVPGAVPTLFNHR